MLIVIHRTCYNFTIAGDVGALRVQCRMVSRDFLVRETEAKDPPGISLDRSVEKTSAQQRDEGSSIMLLLTNKNLPEFRSTITIYKV